jgi:hypothetical protein
VNQARAITAAMLVAALLSVSAAFWLSVFTDREGGVTLLLLRHVPGWPIDTYGETPSQVGRILVRGNENGVMGEDLARWNARYGAWALSGLALGRVWLRARAKRAVASRPRERGGTEHRQ